MLDGRSTAKEPMDGRMCDRTLSSCWVRKVCSVGLERKLVACYFLLVCLRKLGDFRSFEIVEFVGIVFTQINVLVCTICFYRMAIFARLVKGTFLGLAIGERALFTWHGGILR